RVGLLLADSVQAAGFLRLLVEIYGQRHLRLHAKRQLVGVEASGQFAMLRVSGFVNFVDLRKQAQFFALDVPADAWGRLHVEYRRPSRPQRRTLKIGRQEAAGPIRGSALRVSRIGQDDETGEVCVHRAQTVVNPGAEGGIAAELISRVEQIE